MRAISVFFITFFVLVVLSFQVTALDVSPDGPKIVQLPEDGASVIVGNPAHASVVMDNPRVMMINALIPGMTRITVLGKRGNVIFNEHIVVNGPSENYIRVKNACINGGDACQPTRMYYCSEGRQCHNVIVDEPTVSGGESSSEEDGGIPSIGDVADAGGEE